VGFHKTIHAYTREQQISQGAPRGGRHGHTAEEIERFEQMGFIMSDKRRKKRQKQDASTKAGLILTQEEKEMRESELVARFKELVEEQKGRSH